MSLSPPIPAFDRVASVTIQGGAVYGLSLLGQLQAVRDQGYEIAALAGTSAGAMVATLHWAGVEPAAIRDFFRTYAGPPNTVMNLLGGGRWPLRYLRWARSAVAPLPPALNWCGPLAGRLAVGGRGLVGLGGLAWCSRGQGGVFPGDILEKELDRLIRESPKVAPHLGLIRRPAPDLLTFGDLWGLVREGLEFFPALTVTATDLGSGELRLIHSIDFACHHLPIARVMRASGGFPLFFRPVELDVPDRPGQPPRAQRLADGGIVCNFPGFVFKRRMRTDLFAPELWDERAGRDATDQMLGNLYRLLAFQPSVNVGLRLREAAPAAPPPPVRLRWAAGRLWSLLSGGTRTVLETKLSEVLVERPVTVLQPFAQTGWPYHAELFGELGFDLLDGNTVTAMCDAGTNFATAAFAERPLGFARPPAAEVEPRLDDLLVAAGSALGVAAAGATLRAALFVPSGTDLVLAYRANMGTLADTDRAVRLEDASGLAGFCYLRRRPLLCNLQSLAHAPADRQFGLTPDQRRLIRADRTWLLCVPVYDPQTASAYRYAANREVGTAGAHFAELDSPLDGPVFGVLCVDADLRYAVAAGDGLLPADESAQADDPRVSLLRDIMIAVGWRLGLRFDAYFAQS